MFSQDFNFVPNNSLPARLSFTIFGISILVACAATVIISLFFTLHYHYQSIRRWEQEVERFSPVISNTVRNYEIQHTDNLLRVFVRSQPITVGATVYHVGGLLISNQGQTQEAFNEQEGVVRKRLPLFSPDTLDIVGYITLYRKGFSFRKTIRKSALAIIIGVFLICASVAWLIYRKIHTELALPIQQLSESAANYDLHENRFSSPKNGAEELIKLSISLQSMANQTRMIATTDTVTDLPNRLHLESLFLEAEASPFSSCAIILLDLDHFKSINDNFGHDTGDHLLRKVSNRIYGLLSTESALIRVGGDEFAVWFRGATLHDDVHRVGKEIIAAFNTPVLLPNGAEVIVRLSGGIAFYPRDVSSPRDLLKAADLALYRTKANRSADITDYVPSMQEESREWLEIKEQLHHLDHYPKDLFYFQPIVYAKSRQVWGYEMLLRLTSDGKKYFKPEKVLQVASQTSQLNSLTEIAFRQAFSFLEKSDKKTSLTINLSPSQILLINNVFIEKNLLSAPKKIRHQLTLEITERAILDRNNTLDIVKKLKNLGFRFALDDFGSGYSSLSCLISAPIYLVKLDKSLLSRADFEEKNEVLLKSIIHLVTLLKLHVLVEGVESKRQMIKIQGLDCSFAQGYLLGKPARADKTLFSKTPRSKI